MTFNSDEEAELWKDAILRTVYSDSKTTLANSRIADDIVMAYRTRLPKPTNSPTRENKPEQEKPLVQMEWRDARPEDAGKGLVCRVRDGDSSPWRERFVSANIRCILKAYINNSEFCWACDDGYSWRFCQVLAPIEQPKQVEPQPTDDGWRPFEECPDGVVVELKPLDSLIYLGRCYGQRFDGLLHVTALAEGHRAYLKLHPTHFRPIGGGK